MPHLRERIAGLQQNGWDPAAWKNEIAACVQWIKAFCLPTKTIRRRSTSYHYKHSVERWTHETGKLEAGPGSYGRGDLYIPNEAFIAAAAELGYRAVRAGRDSPNCYFNMTRKGPR